MARKVDYMPQTRIKYPWAKWLDGDVWELTPGEDFTCNTPAVRQSAQNYGKSHGFKVETSQQDGKVYVRAILNGDGR